MPRLLKTIEQQVRASVPRLREYAKVNGMLKTAWRLSSVPRDIARRYLRSVQNNPSTAVSDEFDLEYGVETSLRVHPTDLIIESTNWIHAHPYFPTPHGLLKEALANLDIRYEDFTFVDLGSGKGRVLLMASEFSFREIIGVEFSSELHAVALKNIASYESSTQECRNVSSVCMDFTEFRFPARPMVVFLYNPASEEVIRTVARNIARSLHENPRQVWIVYVTPYNVFDSEQFFTKLRVGEHLGCPYSVYTNRAAPT
jgi:SAM-dependent methyltransferase